MIFNFFFLNLLISRECEAIFGPTTTLASIKVDGNIIVKYHSYQILNLMERRKKFWNKTESQYNL